MRPAACSLLLCVTGLLSAADPPPPLVIAGDTKVPAYRLVRLTATGLLPGSAVIWDVSDEDKADADEESGGRLLFTAPPGVYRVKVREIRLEGMQTVVRSARVTVTVGDPPPPPGPTPPGPTPPGPTPDPGTSPFAAPGLRVLILFESDKAATYPTEQWTAIYGSKFQGFLDTACVAGPKVKEWRIWPHDVSARAEPQLWQDALAKTRPTSYPWLVVGNGKAGWQGPFPKTQDEAQALVKGYAQ